MVHDGPGTASRLAARVFSSTWTVAGLLVLSEIIYVVLVRFNAVSTSESVRNFLVLMGVLFVLYGTAYVVLRKTDRRRTALVLIAVGAIVFRMTLLFAGVAQHRTCQELASAIRADIRGEAVTYDSFMLFDNDIWRYLWDGHVGAKGLNPYRLQPRDSALDSLVSSTDGNTFWEDIRANVNHPDIPTIYPPLAQMTFRLAHMLAPGSVLVMKLVLVVFDFATILVIGIALRTLHRPITDVALYAWNPLVIKAVAGSGHVDTLLALLLALTVYFVLRGSDLNAGIAWGLSVLAKISPLILLPFILRRIGWRKTVAGLAVVLLGYAPYLDRNGTAFAGLRTFANEFQFNSGFFTLIEWLAGFFASDPVMVAKAAAALIFLILMGFMFCHDDGERNSFAFWAVTALGCLLLLSPTLMPWYLVWLIPLAVIGRSFSWIQLSPLVCVSFLVMIDGRERSWALCIEYGIFAVLLFREYLISDTRAKVSTSSRCFSQESTHLHQASGE